MAIFDARNSTQDFSMLFDLRGFTSFTGTATKCTVSGISSTFPTATVLGSGFTYSATVPTGGKVTEIIYNAQGHATPDIDITGIVTGKFGLAKMFTQSNDFFASFLSGGDTFYAALNKESYILGDNYTFFSNSQIFSVSGSDTFNMSGHGHGTLLGDTYLAYGREIGGDDVMTSTSQSLQRTTFIGDVAVLNPSGILQGGDDTIDSSGAAGASYIIGDLSWSIRASMTGGEDQLSGGSGNDIICGDADEMDGDGTGGADIINGNDGNDLLTGDFDTAYKENEDATTNTVAGVDDTINGGNGNDTICGDIRILGTGVDPAFGRDVITGGNGNDQIYGDVFSGGPSGIRWTPMAPAPTTFAAMPVTTRLPDNTAQTR